jgi:hypothetical protein
VILRTIAHSVNCIGSSSLTLIAAALDCARCSMARNHTESDELGRVLWVKVHVPSTTGNSPLGKECLSHSTHAQGPFRVSGAVWLVAAAKADVATSARGC